MYDAIVVGARVAGSATAIYLAKFGYRVLLVDKDTFPSFTLSSHLFWARAHALFEELGVLEAIEATSAPALLYHAIETPTRTVQGEFPPVEGHRATRCLRREVLDKILVDAAGREPLIEVREGFRVEELLKDDGRVAGIQGGSPTAEGVTEEARIVVGADGRNSFVASQVKARRYDEDPSQRAMYFGYYRDVPLSDPPMARILARPTREFFILPADDELTVLAVEFPVKEFGAFKRDHEANFDRFFREDDRAKELIGPALREGPLYGSAQLDGWFRVPYGRGWALVGDACHYLDPEPAQGITNALLTAKLLARGLDRAWRREVPEEVALWEYQWERDRELAGMQTLIYRRDEILPPRPVRKAFNQAVAADPELSRGWLGLYNGATNISEYFSPRHVAQALAREG